MAECSLPPKSQAREGDIAEGSPAWESVPAGDRPRRKRGAADKALKLRSPNFAVSRTRLAVRNIPAAMDERGLKKLAIAAVRGSDHVPSAVACSGRQLVLLDVVRSDNFIAPSRVAVRAAGVWSGLSGPRSSAACFSCRQFSGVENSMCQPPALVDRFQCLSRVVLQVKEHASKASPHVKQVGDHAVGYCSCCRCRKSAWDGLRPWNTYSSATGVVALCLRNLCADCCL